MDQTREKLQCAVCGWQWFKRLGQPDPRRCANPDCRSMRWKGDAGTEAGADEHHDVIPEGCSTAEGERDPELASGSVLQAMQPVVDRVVKRIADDLEFEAVDNAVEDWRYEPLDD